MGATFDLDGWYRRFGEAVHRRARRILGDAAAQDAMQETFLRAHRYRNTFAGGAALVWLFTICDRVCFDALKKQKRAPLANDGDLAALDDSVGESEFGAAAPPAPGERLERDQLVRRALAHVDDDTRQILVHRYFDGLDTAAIANALSTSERTVRRRLEDFFTTTRHRLQREASP